MVLRKRYGVSGRRRARRSKARAPKTRAKRTTKRRTKKSTLPKMMKSGLGGEDSIPKQLSVVKNPFSMATNQPKIPDGKSQTSLSRRLRLCKEVTNNFNGSTGAIHIVMMPILGCPVMAFDCVATDTKFKKKWVPFFFKGAGIGYSSYTEVLGTADTTQFDEDVTMATYQGTEMSKWRIVSEGLRLQLMNVMDENDGWWEACRFNWRESVANYGIMQEAPGDAGEWFDDPTALASYKNANGGRYLVHPDTSLNTYLGSLNLLTQPGYESGLLRDINKKQFVLAPHGCESEFNKIPDQTAYLQIQPTEGQFRDIIPNNLTTDQSMGMYQHSLGCKEILNSFLDQSWDALYLRIHPRAQALGGSKLLMHTIQNLELCYPPNSLLAEYQTINSRYAGMEGIFDKMNNTYRPSQLNQDGK